MGKFLEWRMLVFFRKVKEKELPPGCIIPPYTAAGAAVLGFTVAHPTEARDVAYPLASKQADSDIKLGGDGAVNPPHRPRTGSLSPPGQGGYGSPGKRIYAQLPAVHLRGATVRRHPLPKLMGGLRMHGTAAGRAFVGADAARIWHGLETTGSARVFRRSLAGFCINTSFAIATFFMACHIKPPRFSPK